MSLGAEFKIIKSKYRKCNFFMKHCRSCDNCRKDMVCDYLKGIDYYKCEIDGHHIEEPFWEKCEKYQKDFLHPDTGGSLLFQLVQKVINN